MDLPPFPFWVDQKYEAVKLLGKGGGGFAILAKKGGQAVAIKLLNLNLVKNPERAIQRFKKEFLTLKKLSHPHIGKLYDFGFDSNLNQYYFAGEYIEGQDIRQVCQKLSIEEIEKLFVNALQALHYLHTYARAGLRHNDIKTANILVCKTPSGEWQLKLIDFGLTSFVPLEVKGGTASYIPPEQIAVSYPDIVGKEKFPKPDHRVDLYSLGVAWYFCLTGVNPFHVEKDVQATLRRHLGPPPLPPSTIRYEIPAYLDKIILRLLNKNPLDRYESATEVIEDLKFLSGKPYLSIPSPLRQYYLPEGEFINQQQVWGVLIKKWEALLQNASFQPTLIWIVGKRGQGKTKILDHFKNHVQAHEGRMLLLKETSTPAVDEWLADLNRFGQNFEKNLVLAVDDFDQGHLAYKTLKEYWEKIRYHRRWNPEMPIRWMFIFTTHNDPGMTHDDLESITLFLKNFRIEELRGLFKKFPESFIQKLKDHTDGNPLLVTKVLKALGEKGLLWDGSGAWHPTLFENVGVDFNQLAIPKEVEITLGEEWSQFSSEEKKALQFLSCFQDAVSMWDILEFNLKIGPETFEKLVLDGVLEQDSKNRLRFKNSFLQRSIERGLSKTLKEKYHDTIAKFLKKRNRSDHEVAYHVARGSKKNAKGAALEKLANFYNQAGKIPELLEVRRKQLSLKPNIETALYTARLLIQRREFQEALNLLNTWLSKTKQSHKSWRAALLREKGMIFLNDQKMAPARACFEKAYDQIASDKKHLKEQLILKNSIARTYLEERKTDKAISIYQKNREQAKRLKQKEALEVLNNDLGYAYLLHQDGQNALKILQEDLILYEKSQDRLRQIRCHYFLGSLYRRLTKDFNAAIGQYQISVNLAKDIKDNDWLMRINNGLATTYLDRAHEEKGLNAYQQALRYFEESLALCRFLKKDSSELDIETAAITLNIGTVHREMGNFAKAGDAFQTIITVFEAKPKKNAKELGRLCEAYISRADCLSAEKKFSEMEGPLKKAWGLAKSSKDLLEQQLAIQLLWAELSKVKKELGDVRKHLDTIEHLQNKFKIKPTPFAKKRLEELKSSLK